MPSEPVRLTAQQVMRELESLGTEKYKRLLMANYGVREPCFGVKIGDMKPIQKRIKQDYQLALELYDSGNYDAMYLAGLITDDSRMTKKDLQRWADNAYAGSLPGATVAAVAAGSAHGWEMGLKWIDSLKACVAAAGWSTLSGWVALKDDSLLDLSALKELFERVEKAIHSAPDMVRYTMNNFLIAVGSYVKPLTKSAIETADRIGTVTADLGDNSCQVPFASDYIRKVEKRGAIGKKRKTMKC